MFVRASTISRKRQAHFLRRNVAESKIRGRAWPVGGRRTRSQNGGVPYDGQYDVLLSTRRSSDPASTFPPRNMRSSCIAPTCLGLAQLYQLRGRVGRAKIRAYALFTVPPTRALTPQAERRLKLLHSLDTLGAGFELASHDLDIRGAGNLLGDEQSGHIREVGYELYQEMLREAVEALRAGMEEPAEETWSPSITLGTPVTIPENYVGDLRTVQHLPVASRRSHRTLTSTVLPRK